MAFASMASFVESVVKFDDAYPVTGCGKVGNTALVGFLPEGKLRPEPAGLDIDRSVESVSPDQIELLKIIRIW